MCSNESSYNEAVDMKIDLVDVMALLKRYFKMHPTHFHTTDFFFSFELWLKVKETT